jgi:hypothetical protein
MAWDILGNSKRYLALPIKELAQQLRPSEWDVRGIIMELSVVDKAMKYIRMAAYDPDLVG